jgi:large subunit ribosomal protein L25
MANLKVTPRENLGKKVKNDRAEGNLPAALYGPKFASKSVYVDTAEFKKIFDEAGYSNLIDIELDNGEKEKGLVKEVQQNPVTDEFLHASIYITDRKSEITAEVPVELVGIAPAEDLGIGFLVHSVDTVAVRCLPDNLPSELNVDITNLNAIGDSITIADIKLPEGVTLDSKEDPTSVVANIVGAQKEEVEEAAPVEGEGTADGAEATEGEEKESENK